MKEYKVKIKKIDWLDKEGLEAEILFEMKEQYLWAFCHPCDFIENEEEIVSFDFIENEISENEFWNKNSNNIKKIVPMEYDKWSYSCYGQIEQINPIMVNCGPITFSFGNWINDINIINNYVYFVISRLDIIKVNKLNSTTNII